MQQRGWRRQGLCGPHLHGLSLAMWSCVAPGPKPAPNAPLWWSEWLVGVCLWSRANYSSLKEEEEQKKTEEKDKQKKREGSRGKKVNLCCQLLEKHQGLFCFSVCVKRKKRKERRGGKRRDSCLMAWLSVSWKIVASQGEAEADLQEVIKGGESCLSGC